MASLLPVDEALMDFMGSKEYNAAPPGLRKQLMTTFKQASPEDQKRMVYGDESMEGLTLAPKRSGALDFVKDVGKALPSILKHNILQGGKTGAAMAIDTAGQVGGAVAGGAVNPALAVPGEMVGAVAADRVNRAIGLRDPKTVNVPFVGDFENRNIGPVTLGDLAAAAPPAIVRSVSGVLKGFTRPGREALKAAEEADVANLAKHASDKQAAISKFHQDRWKVKADTEARNVQAQEQYDLKRAESKFQSDAALAAAKDKAAAKTKADMDAFNTGRKNILEQFKRDIEDTVRRADLSNQQKNDRYKQLIANRDQRLADHNRAANETFRQASAGLEAPDHRPLYAASEAAATGARQVDVTELNELAEDLTTIFQRPADPYRNPFGRVTQALQRWGVGTAGDEVESPILGPTGAPLKTTTAGTPEGVSLQEVISTHQEVGKTINSTSGLENMAAKRLYAKLDNILQREAAADPNAAKAVSEHVAGQAAWRRTAALQELDDLLTKNTREVAPGQREVNYTGIRTGFRDLLDAKKNPFFGGTWQPEEIKQMQDAIDALPKTPVGRMPTPRPDKPYDFQPAEIRRDRALADQGPAPAPTEPDYSGVQSKWPGPPPTPEAPDYSSVKSSNVGPPPDPTTPDAGQFPFGRFILTKVLGSELAARVAGYQGSMPSWGLAAAVNLVGVPYWTSKALLSSEKGRQILRNITAGKQTLGPKELAALTSAARYMGAKPEEEEE